MREEVLEDLGFSKNEAKVYLALLEIGLATAGKISEKSGVHRTNVYDAITRLVEKGLVSYIEKDGTKYYEATDPENLMNILKEKEDDLKEMIPQFKLMRNLAEYKSEAHIYEGLSAPKRVLDGFLTYKEPILTMGVPKKVSELIKPFLTNFHKRRIAKKIIMKHIYNADAVERVKEIKNMPYTEVRMFPREFDSPVSTNICKDEVVFCLWSDLPITIEIKNEKIAKVYKNYFNLLWNIAKEP